MTAVKEARWMLNRVCISDWTISQPWLHTHTLISVYSRDCNAALRYLENDIRSDLSSSFSSTLDPNVTSLSPMLQNPVWVKRLFQPVHVFRWRLVSLHPWWGKTERPLIREQQSWVPEAAENVGMTKQLTTGRRTQITVSTKNTTTATLQKKRKGYENNDEHWACLQPPAGEDIVFYEVNEISRVL